MKKIVAICLVLTLFCCKNNKEVASPSEDEFLKTEIENWRKELRINGEIGHQITKDNTKWYELKDDCYYDLSNQIMTKIFDANGDAKNDFLLHSIAVNSCKGDSTRGSDFVKLIYSNDKTYLENDNLRNKIELKIENEYDKLTDNQAQRTVFSITGFSTEITGTYQLWTVEDDDCCYSNLGTFKYNPFTLKMEIKNKKVLK